MKNKSNDNLIKNNKRLAHLACILAIVMLVLAGCGKVQFTSSLGINALLAVNEEECTLAEGVFRLIEIKDEYENEDDEIFWERAVGDITMDEYIKQSAFYELTVITAAVLMADEMAITISQEEEAQIETQAAEAYAEKSQTHNLAEYEISVDTVISLYKKQLFYDKVFDELSKDVDAEVSESDTKVIEVSYVELPAELSIQECESIRDEILAGGSFEKVCSDAGYTAVMNAVIKKGDMPTVFENVAYALTDGELSEVVEGTDCMYIIQCVEDYMIGESVANNNNVIASIRQEKFNAAYEEFAAGATLRQNTDTWDAISVPEI